MKYHGMLGFNIPVDKGNGVWDYEIIERPYNGDVTQVYKSEEQGEGVNDNLNIHNQFSIVGDAFLYANYFALTYIEWFGALWKISAVTVARPRLNLTVRGVYNGTRANRETTDTP